ncbi:MAG: hypothetical protein N3A65_00545 [candidate division WOR-3 bacterium]|nr:hypothetical protein [candidate division WOR-3 bacterium]
MRKEFAKIETFEFINNPDELSNLWLQALSGGLKDIKTKEDFIRYYFIKFLGRCLNKEETRGKGCVRVYYGKDGDLLKVKVYDGRGYLTSEINFDVSFNREETETEKSVILPFLEEENIIEITDVQKTIASNKISDNTLIFKTNGMIKIFRKIPLSPLDLYILNPYSFSVYDNLGDEHLFYREGYKLIEMAEVDIDGIINWGKRYEFNPDGLLIKHEYYSGTPWGGVVVNSFTEWIYEPDNKRVTMRYIDIQKMTVKRIGKYEIDGNNRIVKYFDFRDRIRKPMGQDNKIYFENCVLFKEHDYQYDERGRISRVIIINHAESGIRTTEVFGYDEQNRLIIVEEYDKNNELKSSTQYEYISPTKVKVTSRFYPGSFVYHAYQGL